MQCTLQHRGSHVQHHNFQQHLVKGACTLSGVLRMRGKGREGKGTRTRAPPLSPRRPPALTTTAAMSSTAAQMDASTQFEDLQENAQKATTPLDASYAAAQMDLSTPFEDLQENAQKMPFEDLQENAQATTPLDASSAAAQMDVSMPLEDVQDNAGKPATTPLYYASLEEAWFEPPMPGVDDLMVRAGWHRIHWCTREDWVEADWCDQWHPKAHKAAQFLARIMGHVPNPKVLIVGDSTLTWDLGERGEHGFSYNWIIRDELLRAAGVPSSALWAVPGVALHGRRGILAQLRDGVLWGSRPNAILLVGGWNEAELPAETFVDLLTKSALEACGI